MEAAGLTNLEHVKLTQAFGILLLMSLDPQDQNPRSPGTAGQVFVDVAGPVDSTRPLVVCYSPGERVSSDFTE